MLDVTCGTEWAFNSGEVADEGRGKKERFATLAAILFVGRYENGGGPILICFAPEIFRVRLVEARAGQFIAKACLGL